MIAISSAADPLSLLSYRAGKSTSYAELALFQLDGYCRQPSRRRASHYFRVVSRIKDRAMAFAGEVLSCLIQSGDWAAEVCADCRERNDAVSDAGAISLRYFVWIEANKQNHIGSRAVTDTPRSSIHRIGECWRGSHGQVGRFDDLLTPIAGHENKTISRLRTRHPRVRRIGASRQSAESGYRQCETAGEERASFDNSIAETDTGVGVLCAHRIIQLRSELETNDSMLGQQKVGLFEASNHRRRDGRRILEAVPYGVLSSASIVFVNIKAVKLATRAKLIAANEWLQLRRLGLAESVAMELDRKCILSADVG